MTEQEKLKAEGQIELITELLLISKGASSLEDKFESWVNHTETRLLALAEKPELFSSIHVNARRLM